MMKAIVCICLFGMIAATLARPEEDKYTTKYDNFDVDEALGRAYFLNCFLDKGKCTTEGKEVKNRIADGLQNNCGKCNPHQHTQVRKVMKYLINNEPEQWKLLVAKYDPELKYSKKYEDELKTIKA